MRIDTYYDAELEDMLTIKVEFHSGYILCTHDSD